jgi:hypothetical protein
MRIIELDQDQKAHQNTEIAVAGVVRATYTKPFPYFLIEDASATLICQPNGSLPWPGAHIAVTGEFVVETPEHCTVQLAILRETNRVYIFHPRFTCDLASCEFATLPDAAKLNSMWAS